MPRRGDNKRVGTGNSEGNSGGGRGGYYSGGDRFADGGGGRSFSRGGYYGGGGDGWGRRGGGGGGGRRGYRGGGGGGGYRGSNQNRRGYKRNQGNLDMDGKRPKMEVGNRLKEVEIGVTEFVGDHKGFSGVVKERYGDFHVHEIALNGDIAKLTDQSIPPEPEHLDDMEDLKKEVPPEVWEQLETLNEVDSAVSSIDIDVTTMDKDQRRAIHAIAKKTPNTISQTVEKGEAKFIVVARANKQKLSGHKFRRDQRVDWGRRGGNYCHFLLHKVNMDTMDALNQLAMYLRIKSNMLNYAGTKDRRARTTQWVSLKKVNPSDILSAGKSVRGAYVGNFKFLEDPLKLGMLSGNRFRIALRSVTGSDEEIEQAMTTLRDNGFINYYGLQRFGTVAAIPTHAIGKALLQGKWHEAIELILKPRAGEQQRDLTEAREIYQKTKDAHAAYQRIGRPDKIEAKLLWGIHTCGDQNPQGALDWIPRNTSLMYIHAYQSYIWNVMVSKRIKELGPKPVVGDLVYENPNFKEDAERLEFVNNDNEEENDDKKKDQVPTKDKDDDHEGDAKAAAKQETDVAEKSVESIKEETEVKDQEIENKDEDEIKVGDGNTEAGAAGDTENKENSVKDETNASEVTDNAEKDKNSAETDKEDLRSLPAVKTLTEEDLPNYTLADVVMPQPGWRVTYPTYAKPWFDEILAKDNLTTDLRQKNRKYTLGGAYRKMLEVPSDLSWRVMRYKERYDELIQCDVDEMRGLPAPKEDPEGKHKALIVEMSLRPSTYATMALREILKCDTSAQTQAAQSAANKAQEDEEEKKVSDEADKQKPSETEGKENKEENLGEGETKMEVVETEVETEKTVSAKDNGNHDVEKEEKTEANMELSETKNDTETDNHVAKS